LAGLSSVKTADIAALAPTFEYEQTTAQWRPNKQAHKFTIKATDKAIFIKALDTTFNVIHGTSFHSANSAARTNTVDTTLESALILPVLPLVRETLFESSTWTDWCFINETISSVQRVFHSTTIIATGKPVFTQMFDATVVDAYSDSHYVRYSTIASAFAPNIIADFSTSKLTAYQTGEPYTNISGAINCPSNSFKGQSLPTVHRTITAAYEYAHDKTLGQAFATAIR
jgi:hypothetical protein